MCKKQGPQTLFITVRITFRWTPLSRTIWPSYPQESALNIYQPLSSTYSNSLLAHQFQKPSYIPLSYVPQQFVYYPVAINPNTNEVDPSAKEPEATTKSSIDLDRTVKPEKLVDNREPLTSKPQTIKKQKNIQGQPPKTYRPIHTDYTLVKAYQTPNYKFIIDKITQIPGQLFAKLLSHHKTPYRVYYKPVDTINRPYLLPPKPVNPNYLPPFRQITENKPEKLIQEVPKTPTTKNPIVVKAVGRANANPGVVLPNGSNLLILEPSARAVVGEKGTAISAPISRALIRRDSATTILFRPDSVAIAGPGGTAHAQADLIVDYIDE